MSQTQTEYPTGYAPSDLPFYPELDGPRFEQFCTDLLNLHPIIWCLRDGRAASLRIVKADRLLSGTPQAGADIRAVADKGEVWFLQCKHVQKLGPADVSQAIDLAEKELPQADQFVLVTTCGLNPEARKRIDERPRWLWWNASHLTTMVSNLESREGAIILVRGFFGLARARDLFPCSDQPLLTWQEFFASDLSLERKQFHHRVPFVPQNDTLSRLEAFAHSGAGRALILSAAGGQGKSRLLLELARRLEQQPQAPRVRFLNLSRRGLTGEQSDFLAREPEDLLLVVDDAHRLDAAIEDVARATAEAKSVRLLVATRPQGLEALRSQLCKSGYAEKLEEPLRLPRWSSDDIHKLAEQVLAPEHRPQAARLAELADRCPLLVVLGGALIESGAWPETMKGQEAFRERVFKSFKDDFLNRQFEGRRERLNRVINFLSFVSPTPKTGALFYKAAEILGCSPLEVGEDVETLLAARLVVENREGVRLYPDLFADAVLLDACLDQKGQASFLHRTILSKLQIADFPALMCNVAQADWEARGKTGETGRLFDPVWKEFVRRFEGGVWEVPQDGRRELELCPVGTPKDRGPDRAQLLRQWATFAVYLPEKTIELARLAIESAKRSASPTSSASEPQPEIRNLVSASLPPLLKPIVAWHPDYAGQALDVLWSLDADEAKGGWPNDSNAIGVIADAASFAFQKPLRTSEAVMDWLEEKLREPAGIQRLHHQPWILSALLKPFFGRAVEDRWSTDRTVHWSSLPVAVERTRPLRQRAMAIANRLLRSDDVVLCHAVVPVIAEAIQPMRSGSGFCPTPEYQATWRPDRLEAVKLLERVVEAHRDEPVLLLRLRDILRKSCDYDPDEAVREECGRVRLEMPDTFELRVARVLTSFSHDEISPRPGPTLDSDLKAAERQWAEFRRSVALDVVGRFGTANEVCEFLSRMVRHLAATNSVVLGSALLEPIAQISPGWSATLLEEVLRRADPTLDRFLHPLLGEAARQVPEAYEKALDWLPVGGRAQQLCALASFLGSKHLHGGGLTQLERQCVLALAKRTEEAVVARVAWEAGCSFANDPQWGIEVLSRLRPTSERAGHEIVQALGFLAERQAPLLDPMKVAGCLANVGEFLFSERLSDARDLDKVARAFPKQVYEQVRALCERAEVEPAGERGRRGAESLSLGPIGDAEYVVREIGALWAKAISAEKGSFAQAFRMALIRSLLWSDPATAPERLQGLIGACKNGNELEFVTRLAAAQGSRFVFEFPDIVRALLARSTDFSVTEPVREALWLSACGGGRSYTNHELDPEYRYILEQGETLANRYRDDAILEKFYRMVAESERHQMEWNEHAFRDEEDPD